MEVLLFPPLQTVLEMEIVESKIFVGFFCFVLCNTLFKLKARFIQRTEARRLSDALLVSQEKSMVSLLSDKNLQTEMGAGFVRALEDLH